MLEQGINGTYVLREESETYRSNFAGENGVLSFENARFSIVPTIAAQAWITGVFQHGVDPSDPFREGFTLPDLWL